MKTLFFGTGNAKKLKEIHEILGGRFIIKSFLDLPSPLEVEETEPTLEGNARLKAEAFHAATGLPCFADDTGLEVAALGGEPGVYSARYAGPACDPQANMALLLERLGDRADRAAAFRTVIAYCDGGQTRYFHGVLHGKIGFGPRGKEGFGYDPVFIPDGHARTLAEMLPEEKNAISHRGQAVQRFAAFLRNP